ncbi:major_cap_HK97, phage major capsid protein, HK97 family [uncultured Caudovirales phage]|uniref:Major_cap_HK97, phage major capsid protein, HK97 family n=1 Tax=uncultured Caudovirales phage TaxID=2100421 RepID=A0A6J5P6Q2_9CAUD|nr:major_cap_HK97, phage major capsid protein, HK97 family [uncultured Caudovirales phage]CAB4173401.1 major_cap_HK97, phage major capsid protein, HK97 family [uncultured Caudovirales phage]CAB4179690.1 major_cap_HK97, phage major capsid protein, HK97 family [uncultured Caudovirales phage]CAB4204052.1 major_cap_HK97, phage major capsid protein, HK97 family [uncultured Caudovirales phage]CAB4215901.1 major_cap_HK97, phage major capsid protein, HK97 family [uncultured Caudovirales phage]
MEDTKTLSLDAVRKEIGEIAPKLKSVFAEAGYVPGGSLDLSKVTALGEGDERFKSTQLANMTARLSDLGARRQELERDEAAKAAVDEAMDWLGRPRTGAPAPDPRGGKLYVPFGEIAIKNAEKWLKDAKGRANGPVAELDIDVKDFLERELKTVMSTGAGFAPQAIRSGDVVGAAFQMPSVIDLIPVIRTTQNGYVFMRQTTRTNNAAEAAESIQGTLVTPGESAFVWTEITEPIRKIAHFVPVTDEQLEDIEGMLDLINTDMLLGVRQRLSSQIVNGDGTAPNIEGFLDAGRDTTDVDTAGEFIADAIDKLIEKCATTGFVQADAIIMATADWHGYRRATTADGVYIAGHPSENIRPSMWGLPVVPTTEIAAGSAIAGDFTNYSRLVVKKGVEISIASEHANNFVNGVKTVKAEMRAGLALRRETAFSKTDDILVS